MSRNGVLLTIPAGGELEHVVNELTLQWHAGYFATDPWPRSSWLRAVETALAVWLPQSSSNDRQLTARTLAPFPLAQPGVR